MSIEYMQAWKFRKTGYHTPIWIQYTLYYTISPDARLYNTTLCKQKKYHPQISQTPHTHMYKVFSSHIILSPSDTHTIHTRNHKLTPKTTLSKSFSKCITNICIHKTHHHHTYTRFSSADYPHNVHSFGSFS